MFYAASRGYLPVFFCSLSLTSPTFAGYDPDAPMSMVSNGDIDIAYLVEKSADPILIMGLAASHRIWNPAIIDGLLRCITEW